MDNLWQTPALIALAALLLDVVVGDPQWLVHPVVLIGRLISTIEKAWLRARQPAWAQRALGVALAVCVPAVAAGAVYLVCRVAGYIHPWLATLVAMWFASTTIAAKGLAAAGLRVYKALAAGDLTAARKRAGEIVGRDTNNLSESEVCRAAVETVAENMVDAIISPVFFCLLGGAPLAMAYRAVNTLDSMVGYKNYKYRYFGWASARLDDIANWIPARIAAILVPLAAGLSGLNSGGACRTIRRDARRHPSPNSGIPEAGVAGALGVQLGGLNYYQGVPQLRATMGDALTPLRKEHIVQTARLMWVVTGLLAAMVAVALTLIRTEFLPL